MSNFFFRLMYIIANIFPIFMVLSIVFVVKQEFLFAFICLLIAAVIYYAFSYLFLYGEKKSEKISVEITRVSLADNLTPSYILSSLSILLSLIENVDLYMCILFSFSMILILSSINIASPNIILSLKKYHFYYVDTAQGISYVLISKEDDIRSTSQIECVNKFFSFLLVDAGKNNV